MPLSLSVDGPRWREHLRATVAASPGLVPVAKGNGYGFTVAGLARRAEWLGADTIAVGTYAEVADVEEVRRLDPGARAMATFCTGRPLRPPGYSHGGASLRPCGAR